MPDEEVHELHNLKLATYAEQIWKY